MNTAHHTKEPYYITVGYLRCLLDYLHERNLPLGQVLQAMGLTEAELDDPNRRVPYAAEAAAFAVAEELTGDHNIGLHVGLSTRLTHLGILGHLIMSCANIGEMFSLHMRYQQLLGNGGNAEYRVIGDAVLLNFQRQGHGLTYSRHVIEFIIASAIGVTRWLSDTVFMPSYIAVTYPQPADIAEHEKIFRCPVYFDRPQFEIGFPLAALTLPLRGDPSMLAALESEAKKRLQTLHIEQVDTDPQVMQIKQLIAARLSYGAPEVSAVALALDISVRSLQRHLEIRGTSYTHLIEQVRQSMAERYMHDLSLSLADIALLLGFSEQSTFQRAFKRWFETTPKQYRLALA